MKKCLSYIEALTIFKDFNVAIKDVRKYLKIKPSETKRDFFNEFIKKGKNLDILKSQSFKRNMIASLGKYENAFLKNTLEKDDYEKKVKRREGLKNDKYDWENKRYPTLNSIIMIFYGFLQDYSKERIKDLRNHILYGTKGGFLIEKRYMDIELVSSPISLRDQLINFEPHISIKIYGNTQLSDLEEIKKIIKPYIKKLPNKPIKSNTNMSTDHLSARLRYYDKRKNQLTDINSAKEEIMKEFEVDRLQFSCDNLHETEEFKRLEKKFFKEKWADIKSKISFLKNI